MWVSLAQSLVGESLQQAYELRAYELVRRPMPQYRVLSLHDLIWHFRTVGPVKRGHEQARAGPVSRAACIKPSNLCCESRGRTEMASLLQRAFSGY